MIKLKSVTSLKFIPSSPTILTGKVQSKLGPLPNGGGTQIPTEKDDIHTEENRPTLSFITPTTGSTVSGTFPVNVATGGTRPISRVEFSVNGTNFAILTNAPWNTQLNADTLPTGSNIITATVVNDVGLSRTEQITVNVTTQTLGSSGGSTAQTAFVTGISAQDGRRPLVGTPTPIRLTWSNPSASDLASVNIYISTSADSNDLGSLIKQVSAPPGSSGVTEIDVSTLILKRQYWFTLKTVSNHGVENPSGRKGGPAQVQP